MYKVYMNDKEIFFTKKKDVVNEHNTSLFLTDPDINRIHDNIIEFISDNKNNKLYFVHRSPKKLFKAFAKKYKIVKAAGGIVRNKDDRILFIFRREKWDLPKGKVDKKETKKHAALREVAEETGLETLAILRKTACTYHTYTEKEIQILKKTYWYEMFADKDEPLHPQAEEDITEIRWVSSHEMSDIIRNTYPLIKDLIKEFEEIGD